MTSNPFKSELAKPTTKPHFFWDVISGEWLFEYYPMDGNAICNNAASFCNYMDVVSNPTAQ